MKKISIICCLALLALMQVKAQKQICGNDTVIINLSNFHYGEIRWEESVDSVNWVTIPNACDTFYKFFANKNKYIRALGITGECPPNYSEVTYVAKPVTANAGVDRVYCGDSLSLTANLLKKSTGIWTMLSGNGGQVFDNLNPNSSFMGNQNNTYSLLWTLSNICGTSYDTVNVEFVHNVYRNNYIIVDSTDKILSDSIEMSNGQYTIVFSSPVPNITDTTILIGAVGEGFLRKVRSFSTNSDTFYFETDQGSLSDFTIDGAFNFAPNIYPNVLLTRSGNMSSLNKGKYPTRKDIQSGKFKDGELAFEGTQIDFIEKGLEVRNPGMSRGGVKLVLTLKDVTLYSDTVKHIEVTASGSVTIEPNFVAQLEIRDLKLKKFDLGMNNANIEYNLGATLEISKSFDIPEFKKTLFKYDKTMVFMAGAVPVVVTAGVKLNVNFSLEVGGKIEITAVVDKTDVVSAGLRYNTSSNKFESYFDYDDEVELNIDGDITASIDQVFTFGPEVNVKLYGVLGTYLDLKILKETFNLCTSFPDWSSEFNISTDVTVGARAAIDLWFFTLTLIDYSKTFSFGWYKNQFPYTIEVLTGNNQVGAANSYLPNVIEVQVKSNQGAKIPFVPVRFETSNGSVSKSLVFTDINGKARVNWKIGNKNGAQVLKASVYDCEGEDIDNSPLEIFGSDSSYYCIKSSLNLKISKDAVYIYPVASGGKTPYTYSRDGKSWVVSIRDNLVDDSTYRYYVKDADGCMRTKSYYYLINPCSKSTLNLNVFYDINYIDASGSGGVAPYSFALNNKKSFASKSRFNNLAPGKYKVYLMDKIGCIDSLEVNLLKKIYLPSLSTKTATGITSTSAITGGTITSNGGSSIIQSGVCWNTSPNPTTDNNTIGGLTTMGGFTDTLTSLKANTKYYVRAYAMNVAGTSYGNSVIFNTSAIPGTVETNPLVGLTSTSASCGGTITSTGGGVVTASGICWATTPNPTLSNSKTVHTQGQTSFTDTMRGLSPNIIYYVRAYVTNSAGTSYGKQISFKTAIADIDGNIYDTVVIGTQVWLKPNYRATKYLNGDTIANVTQNSNWNGLSTGAFCNYQNTTKYADTFGRLYNFHAIADARKLCPYGWHVPSDSDWTVLTTFLGGESVAGGYLKETGTKHWLSPNTGASNSTGYTALPAGARPGTIFQSLGYYGYYSSSTTYSSTEFWYRKFAYNSAAVVKDHDNKVAGLSVRCLRDLSHKINLSK